MLRNLSYLKVALALSICILPSSLYAAPSEEREQPLAVCNAMEVVISVAGDVREAFGKGCYVSDAAIADLTENLNPVHNCDTSEIVTLTSALLFEQCNIRQKPTTEGRTAETTGNNTMGRR